MDCADALLFIDVLWIWHSDGKSCVAILALFSFLPHALAPLSLMFFGFDVRTDSHALLFLRSFVMTLMF